MSEDQAPEGYEWEWVPEDTLTSGWDWDLVLESEAKQCRYTDKSVRCEEKSVVRLNRSPNPSREQWWHYCEQHMFGRRLTGWGTVEVRVLREVSR